MINKMKLLIFLSLLFLTACSGDYCINNDPSTDILPNSYIVNATSTTVYGNGFAANAQACAPTPSNPNPACGGWAPGPNIDVNSQGETLPVLIRVSGQVNLCSNDVNAPPVCPVLQCPSGTQNCCTNNCTLPSLCPAGTQNCCGSSGSSNCTLPTLCPSGTQNCCAGCTMPTECPSTNPGCNTDPYCAYGGPNSIYSIFGNNEAWQPVSNVNPGDLVQLTVVPPTNGCPNILGCSGPDSSCSCSAMGCSSSQCGSPGCCASITSSNKYYWINTGGQAFPSFVASPTALSGGQVFNESSGWNVAGIGLLMYINPPGIHDNDTSHFFLANGGNTCCMPGTVSNCTGNLSVDGNTCIGGVTYSTLGNNMNSGSLQTTYERITTQTITATQPGKVNLMFIDAPTDYIDNLGGYNVYVIRQCLAYNGLPQAANNVVGNLVIQVNDGSSGNVTLGNPISSCSQADSSFASYCSDNDIKNNVAAYYYIQNPPAGSWKYSVNVGNNSYSDVSGVLNVNTYTQGQTGAFSALISQVINVIQNALATSVTKIYNNITSDTNYITYLRVLLELYIIFYGIMFLLGIVQISQMDLIIRVFKIGVIVAITSPNSWDFFNNNFFDLFVNGSSELINLFTGSNCSTSGEAPSPFCFVDNVFQVLFFDYRTWLRILAIVFTTPLGFIYVILMLWGVVNYFIAIVEAIITYIMSILAVQILLALAPIFIPFILFQITRELFTKWIHFLFAFALKPIILLIGLNILSTMLFIIVIQLVSYPICFGCAFPIELGFLSDIVQAINNVVTIGNLFFCIPFVKPWGFNQVGDGITLVGATGIQISTILLFVLITSFMKKLPHFVEDMTERLTETRAIALKVGGGGGAVGGIMNSMKNTALGALGMSKSAIDRRRGKNLGVGPTAPKQDIGVRAREK
jgi:type IV secretory pathway VirB6-like protein